MARRKQMVDAEAETVEAPPYRLSRAAMRERYGTRRIDGTAPQSDRDFTPSGRIRRNEQAGMSTDDATKRGAAEFNAEIYGRRMPYRATTDAPIVPMGSGGASAFSLANTGFSPANPSDLTPVSPGYVPPVAPPPTPNPIAPSTSATSAFGASPGGFVPAAPANLTPLSFNLSAPSPISASAIAPYLPTNASGPTASVPPWRKPASPGYMGSIFANTNKWLTS